jgi:hypothetical protein
VRVQNLLDFGVQSPVITLTYPEDNVVAFLFGVKEVKVPAGTYTPSVSDGYWLIIAPLSNGMHTIRVRGAAAGGFSGETTYHLTVGN